MEVQQRVQMSPKVVIKIALPTCLAHVSTLPVCPMVLETGCAAQVCCNWNSRATSQKNTS